MALDLRGLRGVLPAPPGPGSWAGAVPAAASLRGTLLPALPSLLFPEPRAVLSHSLLLGSVPSPAPQPSANLSFFFFFYCPPFF